VCLTVAQRALVRGVSGREVLARAATMVALVVLILVGGDLPPVAFAGATTAGLLALVVFEMWAYRQAQTARLLAASRG
jgi:hypothetical protein